MPVAMQSLRVNSKPGEITTLWENLQYFKFLLNWLFFPFFFYLNFTVNIE